MSQENVDLVREAVEAWDSGDVPRFIALAHADFEGNVSPELSAEPDTYRGTEGIRRYFESFADAFDDIRFEVEQLLDAGDSVVVAMRMSATSKRTRIPVEQRNAGVWTVLDRKIVGIDSYASLPDAIRAAGLHD